MPRMPTDDHGKVIQAFKLSETVGTISVSGTSAQSAAIGAAGQEQVVAVYCATAFYIRQGSNPTATTGDYYVPADTVVHLVMDGGNKLAAILASGSDTLKYMVAGEGN